MSKSKQARLRSVRIGGMDYAVEYVQDLHDDTGKLDGRIHHGRTTIQLDAGMSDQGMDQALLHELVHGILTQLGKQKISRDEGLVDALAYSIVQIIRDNVQLTRRIQG